MARHPDWEARLHDYIESALDRPFAFGQHDCVLHGARGVEALTGVDHTVDHCGRYSTALGSKRHLTRAGFKSVEALFDHHLPAIAPALAQRGDPVLADGAIGLCYGGYALFVGTDGSREGLIRRPRSEWQKAWAVR